MTDSSALPEPPHAVREPSTRTVHGDSVVDDYAWMADRDDPRLTAYLEAENAYAAARTRHVEPLAETIFDEIRARTKETDLSVPVHHGGWWYYGRTVEDLQYPIAGRVDARDFPERPVLPTDGPPVGEHVVLDENVEAKGHDFFALGASDVSPDGTRLAYAVDVTGDEQYDLRVRDLATGAELDDSVTRIAAGVAWSLDGDHLFYTRYDEAWRPYQVWRHEVGGPADEDVLVHEESDETFRVGVGSSRDDRWVVIAVASSTSSEYRLIDAARPKRDPILVAARSPKVEYDVEPIGDELFVLHNRDRVNFEVARAVLSDGAVGTWEPLNVSSEDELVTGVDAFATFLAVSLRTGGQTAIRIVPRDPLSRSGFRASWDVAFDEPLRTVGVGDNPEIDTHTLRVFYTSMVTPPSVGEYDLETRELRLLKRTEVRGGYDPADYVQSLEWATAPDGARVPVSVARKATTPLDGSAAAVIYGYGAYGASLDPWFSVARLSLLDRGLVFAIAHTRGGEELGRPWYQDGKLMAKQHTFDDFVAAGSLLVEKGYAHTDRLAGQGGSAGGLVIGAVANQVPGRFRALHAQVPFVDVLTTMLDPSLPLTAGEWEEWGDPINDPEAYAYIKAYSPYDNVGEHPYPAILVTTNVHDMRVYITEPAKWVARLRERSTSDPARDPILLRAWMTAGHGGQSGRYDAWRETAWELAVLLDLLQPR